jgi:hypothetical protein
MEQSIQPDVWRRKRWLAIIGAALAVAAIVVAIWFSRRQQPITLHGVVLTQDADPRKQLPISGVAISVAKASGLRVATTSDSLGGFALTLSRGFRVGQPMVLNFKHAGYQPLLVTEPVSDRIYIARMLPAPGIAAAESSPNAARVANVRLRYTINTTTDVNVGSVAKTFEVVNTGNVPCNGHPQCSPDGKWKAAVGSLSLDAGEGNQFRNARVSCIAGPCPFTRVEQNSSSHGGRNIYISVLDWSDTAIFLVEAEVFHPMVSDVVRSYYPVVFGRVLDFILPAQAEGPSLEAEINGTNIVFPLGPKLNLSWATCAATGEDQSRSFHCELKPGYRF